MEEERRGRRCEMSEERQAMQREVSRPSINRMEGWKEGGGNRKLRNERGSEREREKTAWRREHAWGQELLSRREGQTERKEGDVRRRGD